MSKTDMDCGEVCLGDACGKPHPSGSEGVEETKPLVFSVPPHEER